MLQIVFFTIFFFSSFLGVSRDSLLELVSLPDSGDVKDDSTSDDLIAVGSGTVKGSGTKELSLFCKQYNTKNINIKITALVI